MGNLMKSKSPQEKYAESVDQMVEQLRPVNKVAIFNSRGGVRVIKNYRWKGNTFQFSDEGFKDENGNAQTPYVTINSGWRILDRVTDRSLIKFLVGEMDENGNFVKGSRYMGCPEIIGSAAYNELVGAGTQSANASLYFLDPSIRDKEKEAEYETVKAANKVLYKITEKEQMVRDTAFALKNYIKGATVRTMESDLYDYLAKKGKHKEFLELFEGEGKGKDIKLKEAYQIISFFRQGFSKQEIVIDKGAYTWQGTILGYAEPEAATNLHSQKDKWQLFLGTLKKTSAEVEA